MKKLRCLTLDDEPHALKILELYIEKMPYLELTKATTSPWEALEVINKGDIDLIFLDIQMEDLSGIQLLEVANTSCPVIITTAYTDYAIQGYEYEVKDYLLKPYSFDRFLKAVAKVYEKQNVDTKKEESERPKDIFVKGDTKNSYHRIPLQDIRYIEGLKNYVKFILKNSEGERSIITLQNLKDLENQLPEPRFMRIHRSYIVHTEYISRIEGHSVDINGQLLPIGQKYREGFFEWIEKHS